MTCIASPAPACEPAALRQLLVLSLHFDSWCRWTKGLLQRNGGLAVGEYCPRRRLCAAHSRSDCALPDSSYLRSSCADGKSFYCGDAAGRPANWDGKGTKKVRSAPLCCSRAHSIALKQPMTRRNDGLLASGFLRERPQVRQERWRCVPHARRVLFGRRRRQVLVGRLRSFGSSACHSLCTLSTCG